MLLAAGGVIFGIGVAIGRVERFAGGATPVAALSLLGLGGAVLVAGAVFRWLAQRL